ncbi:MAG: peptide/nickel transport system permease protein [Natronomonas sp.]|jgi:peptide/nickel transport system permease protein
MSTQRGRINISGFDADAVEQRDELSDWSDDEETTLESRWRKVGREIVRDRLALIGGTIVFLMALLAIFAQPIRVFGVTVQPISITPYDPSAQFVAGTVENYATPSFLPWSDGSLLDYPMGTDILGRDVFSRVIAGARYSVTIGLIVTALSGTFGVVYGAVSGYFGGKIDGALMRFVDMVFAFPGLILAIVIVSMLGKGYWQLVIAFAATSWATYARLMRGEILKVKQNEYVLAAKALGGRDRRVLFRHVVPNAIAPVIVQATLSIGTVVIGVAALGFLGVGFPTGTAEWGTMINAEQSTVLSARGWVRWWVTVFPGLMLFLFVMAMNMIGDAINDALDAQGGEELDAAGGGG